MDLDSVFEELSQIMRPFAETLDCTTDEPGYLYIDTHYIMKNKKPLFFGSVQIKKNYVSYHLMPIYVNPSLLDNVTPALARRMQGKSCFNFKQIDGFLFKELRELTLAGFQYYETQGYV